MLTLPMTSIGSFRLQNASLSGLQVATGKILSEYLLVTLTSLNK